MDKSEKKNIQNQISQLERLLDVTIKESERSIIIENIKVLNQQYRLLDILKIQMNNSK